eukprot:GHRR01010235.1.p1 GENE.GHRR01010235.1~~GHRR01010235.1.p1  ORF type:complete len:141 (+),score=25.00 GHRR01010235.1:58-480(+)
MSQLLARKLGQQVVEIRSLPDNKRCFNCETLGTTYYVPQFSIFVCTQCSGIHMQFGQRVKSVTLAEYKSDEVEHMKEGGNQVAAYKYLARYTPDKDLKKPLDRYKPLVQAVQDMLQHYYGLTWATAASCHALKVCTMLHF